MKTQSHEQPNTVENIGGGYRINFNVEEKVKEDEHGSHNYFEYSTAVSPTLDRGDLITAIIRTEYSSDDEFALLNNLKKGDQKYIDEYEAYQKFRAMAKELAGEICN